MEATRFFFLLFCQILGTSIGLQMEKSSSLSTQDNTTSQKQMVLQLQDRMSSLETSISQMIQAEYEQILITVLDEMEAKLENYANNRKVSEMGEALQALLSNHSLRVDHTLRNQTLQINRLSRQMEEFQNRCVGEPPSLRNGRPVDFERKHGSYVAYQCDRNFVVSGNSTVHCNLGKWVGQPPVCMFFDTTFTLRAHWDSNYYLSNVSCSREGNPQTIEFSRILDTGTGGALPSGSNTYSRGKAAVLDLSGVGRHDKRGVYQCGFDTDGTRMGISFLVQQFGYFRTPQVVSIGDAVQIGSVWVNHRSIRWLHDGQRVPAGDGRSLLAIDGVRAADSGVYERFTEGNRLSTQEFFRLVVRTCRADIFGERCDQKCLPCYNGGVCHDRLGTCSCPPGFEGISCEVACGKDRFGPNCSESCDGGDCKWQMFCKPDPYGCSCAPGYGGFSCSEKCDEGTFGAGCKQTCHCSEGRCDPYTGTCAGGCSPGWTGQSCQIPAGR